MDRLEAFEKMLSDIKEQSEYENVQLQELKAQGKEKTATYRQFFGNNGDRPVSEQRNCNKDSDDHQIYRRLGADFLHFHRHHLGLFLCIAFPFMNQPAEIGIE